MMLKKTEMMRAMTQITILNRVLREAESPGPNSTVIKKRWPTMPMIVRRILRLE